MSMRTSARTPCEKAALRLLGDAVLLLPLAVLLGCMRSPSFNVLGSYFPGWIACVISAVLVTAVLRWALHRAGLEERLPMLPLFYFSLASLIACVFWLIAFE